jgi:hypothetical protein
MEIPGRLLWSIQIVEGWLAQRTPELPTKSPLGTAPAHSPRIDLSAAFGTAAAQPPMPAKTPGRGRPRGSKSIK